MLKNDLDNLSTQSKQRILIENIQKTDQQYINDFNDQQEVVEIQTNSKSIENPIAYNELNTKCQKLELELKNLKQNYEKLIKQTNIQQEKIKILEVQEINYIQCLDENFLKNQNLDDKIQQLESELQKQKEQILSLELIINKKQEQINQFEIKNNELRSKLQEYNQIYKKRIKKSQDSYEMNQNTQYSNREYQTKKQNNQKVDQILIEKLQIKDNIILYLQNQLADLKVTKLLTNQQKQNKTTQINDQQIVNNSSHKNLITQTSEKSLIQSQILTSQVLPPKGDQKLIQSQFNFESKKQNFSFDASINVKILEDFQGNNKSLINLNQSITQSLNQDYQSKNHDY